MYRRHVRLVPPEQREVGILYLEHFTADELYEQVRRALFQGFEDRDVPRVRTFHLENLRQLNQLAPRAMYILFIDPQEEIDSLEHWLQLNTAPSTRSALQQFRQQANLVVILRGFNRLHRQKPTEILQRRVLSRCDSFLFELALSDRLMTIDDVLNSVQNRQLCHHLREHYYAIAHRNRIHRDPSDGRVGGWLNIL